MSVLILDGTLLIVCIISEGIIWSICCKIYILISPWSSQSCKTKILSIDKHKALTFFVFFNTMKEITRFYDWGCTVITDPRKMVSNCQTVVSTFIERVVTVHWNSTVNNELGEIKSNKTNTCGKVICVCIVCKLLEPSYQSIRSS